MKIKTQELKNLTRSEMKKVMGGTVDSECLARCWDQNAHHGFDPNWTAQNGSVVAHCNDKCMVVNEPY